MLRNICFFVWLLFPVLGYGGNILGSNYLAGSLGVMKFGDTILNEFYGNSPFIAVENNNNIAKNIDIKFNGSYLVTKGNDTGISQIGKFTTISASISYLFLPMKKINPFISIESAYYDARFNTNIAVGNQVQNIKTGDSDTGYGVSLGMELIDGNTTLLFIAQHFTIDVYNTNSIVGTFGYWTNKKSMLGISAKIDDDEKDMSISLSMLIRI